VANQADPVAVTDFERHVVQCLNDHMPLLVAMRPPVVAEIIAFLSERLPEL